MTRKNRAVLHVIFLPFAISASFEFLPAWLYWPILILGGMSWIGALLILAEKNGGGK